MAITATLGMAAPRPAGATAEPLAFADIAGWTADDHLAALRAFKTSCRALRDRAPVLRDAVDPDADLRRVCTEALDVPEQASSARAFFETAFVPFRIRPDAGAGFLTGYYEPEIDGSLTRTPAFAAPVYARPDDLVAFRPGEGPPQFDPALAGALRTATGLEPYPTRTEIYDGALAGRGLEILYLRDEPEVFIVQVQGSARIRLPDGRKMRLRYAGRNGHPYTSIGRLLINEGRIKLDEMSLARLMGWLRANPDEAWRIMSANKSYVFFALESDMNPAIGPTGGAGVPLTPGRSLAVDRAIWSYGLPVWCAADIGTLEPAARGIARLMIAQDTGTAIVGPARADFFWGSGDEAGRKAGLTRHALDFIVLWPKGQP